MLKQLKSGVALVVAALFMTGCTTLDNGMDSSARGEHAKRMVADMPPEVKAAALGQNFPAKRAATGKNTFVFDPAQTAWAAYDHTGSLIRTGEASGGSDWCADIGRDCKTAVGTFSVYRKGGPNCISSKFPIRKNGRNGGAPMPYCMFFKGGMAVHASNAVPDRNTSHGCVRVPPTDAEWLYNNFMDIGTKVVVMPYP